MNESYETILTRMQDTFSELSGFQADDASDIGIRLKVLAGEIFSAYSNIEWLKNQVFPQTATGQQLDYHAQQRGLQRKPPLKASGSLTFSVSTALTYDISIPQGTICSTAKTDSQRYVTKSSAVLKAGQTSVSVDAEAEIGGTSGNCLENTITILVTPPTGITSVKNAAAFTGGTQGEDDESLRTRILNSYNDISNGTNAAFYKARALKNENVSSASAIPINRGNGTVDVYIWANGTPSESLISEVQADLNSLKEINVDVKVAAPTTVACNFTAYIWVEDGYVYDDVKLACADAVKNYISSLKIGEDMFLSKAGMAVLNVPGVKNYRIISSNTCTDISIDDDEIASIGSIGFSKGS